MTKDYAITTFVAMCKYEGAVFKVLNTRLGLTEMEVSVKLKSGEFFEMTLTHRRGTTRNDNGSWFIEGVDLEGDEVTACHVAFSDAYMEQRDAQYEEAAEMLNIGTAKNPLKYAVASCYLRPKPVRVGRMAHLVPPFKVFDTLEEARQWLDKKRAAHV